MIVFEAAADVAVPLAAEEPEADDAEAEVEPEADPVAEAVSVLEPIDPRTLLRFSDAELEPEAEDIIPQDHDALTGQCC